MSDFKKEMDDKLASSQHQQDIIIIIIIIIVSGKKEPNETIIIIMRMCRMEKVPGHGICPDLSGPGRPARSRQIFDPRLAKLAIARVPLTRAMANFAALEPCEMP